MRKVSNLLEENYDLLTIRGVTEQFGGHPNTWRNKFKSEEIPATKSGNTYFVTREAILNYLGVQQGRGE